MRKLSHKEILKKKNADNNNSLAISDKPILGNNNAI